MEGYDQQYGENQMYDPSGYEAAADPNMQYSQPTPQFNTGSGGPASAKVDDARYITFYFV